MSNKMILVNIELLKQVAEQLEHYMGDLRSDACITLRAALDASVQRLSAHDLIKTGDPDASDAITDRNGEVVLAYCRRCKGGESDLGEHCKPVQHPESINELLRETLPIVRGTQGAEDHELAERIDTAISAPVQQPVIELQSGDITEACNLRKNAMAILYSDVVASIEAAGLKVMKS